MGCCKREIIVRAPAHPHEILVVSCSNALRHSWCLEACSRLPPFGNRRVRRSATSSDCSTTAATPVEAMSIFSGCASSRLGHIQFHAQRARPELCSTRSQFKLQDASAEFTSLESLVLNENLKLLQLEYELFDNFHAEAAEIQRFGMVRSCLVHQPSHLALAVDCATLSCIPKPGRCEAWVVKDCSQLQQPLCSFCEVALDGRRRGGAQALSPAHVAGVAAAHCRGLSKVLAQRSMAALRIAAEKGVRLLNSLHLSLL
mmetsp:Transcript_129130/g.248881  ORF Transcript_129130/g.248881 Transcript_129130/m.248881 type:complete len:258 (-) Transcript_129130:2355-3128(-)